MPAFAAITINDGATTPVAKTFNPVEISRDGVAVWAEQSGGISIGFPVITMSLRQPTTVKNGERSDANTRVARMKTTVSYPVLETAEAGQPPIVAYILRHNEEKILPERSATQDRKHLHAFAANLADHATYKALCIDLQNNY